MGNCFATQVLDIDHTPCPKKYSGPSQVPPTLKKFTLAELSAATGNFRPASALGCGGFGGVFKGWVDEKTYAPSKPGSGMAVAVKRLNPDGEQGIKEWEAEIRFLGKFSHPNLVKLLGYCGEDNEFLLVYEYMKKRSLDNHLFKGKGVEPLSWETRLKIVIGAANGLAFLHSSEKCVIYRDFKAANILLDENYNAKLSDFGLAKFGPVNGDSHLTTDTMPMGSHGYAAPEYIATGHLYVKSDVYGFGVVLLEMLTGMKVIDLNRPNGQQNLVLYSRPFLKEERRLRKIVDPRLEGKYPTKGAKQVAQLVLECLVNDPKKRPSMEEVLEALQRISCIKNTPSYNEIEQTASPLDRKFRGRNRSRLHSMRGGASYKARGH